MAPPVYSVSIHQEQGLNGTRIINVPAGYVFVLRDVWVYQNAGWAIDGTVHLIGDADQTLYRWDFPAIGTNPNGFWQGRAVLAVQYKITTTQPTDVTASGYQLALP